MFCRKKDQEISRLRGELEALGEQERTHRDRADTLAEENMRLRAEVDELSGRAQLLDGLSGPLNQFADSAKALQGSLAAMAQAMKNETREAVKTSGETA